MKPKTKILAKSGKKSIGRYIVQFGEIIILTILILLLPQQNVYLLRAYTETYAEKQTLLLPTPAPYPVNLHREEAPPISAYGTVIKDVASGVTLYEKNPEVRLFPASTTKIMTALVSLEDYHLEDPVTVKTVVTEGQVMGLTSGETLTVENLLYGTLVHSANDAAYALAEHHAGGVDGFIARMNEKAGQLHLTGTHFTNPIGFDNALHYTTPKDLANLSLVALKNQTLTKIVAVPQITISDTSYTHFHPLKNVNELLGKVPGVSGLKTGWTAIAGQALVTTVRRQDNEILITLLKSDDRFKDTEQLLNWVFANFEWKEFTPSTGD